MKIVLDEDEICQIGMLAIKTKNLADEILKLVIAFKYGIYYESDIKIDRKIKRPITKQRKEEEADE